MTFLHPEFLYYMLPPLFILFGFLLTQKEAQGQFFSNEVMDKLRVSANTLTLRARNALFLLMGFFMIIALAGPVINDGTVEVKAKSADIMIAFDISDSMLAKDVYPSRLVSAKQKATELLKTAQDERIGVVAFARNSYLVSPMSFDHSAVSFLLRQLNTDSITEKGTDFLSLLDVVQNTIKTKGKKHLLILSDGGDKNDFSDEIAFAKENNIVIFILGVGTLKGAPIKKSDGSYIKHKGEIIVSKLNENISKLATSTGGVYIQSVKSNQDIKAMLKEIKSNSEQRELKSEKVHKFIPLFYYPVAMALLILIIATSSMSKRQRLQMPASVFILFLSLLATPHAKAGLLDFVELKEAKESYKSGDYEKSAKLYKKYESYFNEGNSLYKQKKYDEAIKAYEKATFDDEISRANNLANKGNAFVKQAKKESLQKAVESYEKSLKLHEDKEVRENLEAVKKEIEKQKKKEQEKKDKDKQKDKGKKNKDKNKKDSDNQDNDKKDSKDDKKSDEDSKGDKKNKSENDESKEKKQNEEDKSKENNETKPQDEKKNDLKELNKDEDNKTKENSSSKQLPHAKNQDEMSDAEEEKWLRELNMQQSTFMYMLNNKKTIKRDENEKPW